MGSVETLYTVLTVQKVSVGKSFCPRLMEWKTTRARPRGASVTQAFKTFYLFFIFLFFSNNLIEFFVKFYEEPF